jgi:DNA-binding PadR family transcriptional regulator
MSATRLLVLGVVRGFGRAHGYLVRSELVGWGAENWANIKWGSLYHALRKLADDGLFTSTEIEEWPGRVDYTITPEGEAEFFRLLRAALREPAPRPDMLFAGLSLLPALTRAEAIELLSARLSTLSESQAQARDQIKAWREPPHVLELFGLWEHSATDDIAWTRGMVSRLQSGMYAMAGEPDAVFGIPGSWEASGADPAGQRRQAGITR